MLGLSVCCLQALLLKCSTLPLPHYCQTRQEMFLRLVDIASLCSTPSTKIFLSYLSYIVCFNEVLIGSLLLVLICMISTCYPLFMFSPHTTCFFSLLGFSSCQVFIFPLLPFCVCSERSFDVIVLARPSCLDQVSWDLFRVS